MAQGICVGVAAVLVFLTLHLILWRTLRRPFGEFKILLVLAAGGAVGIYFFKNSGERELPLALYGLAIVMYFHLYVGMQRSLSIRVMEELSTNPNRSIAVPELAARYSPQAMFSTRIAWLIKGGWLQLNSQNALVCTGKAERLAKVLRIFHALYNLRQTG